MLKEVKPPLLVNITLNVKVPIVNTTTKQVLTDCATRENLKKENLEPLIEEVLLLSSTNAIPLRAVKVFSLYLKVCQRIVTPSRKIARLNTILVPLVFLYLPFFTPKLVAFSDTTSHAQLPLIRDPKAEGTVSS